MLFKNLSVIMGERLAARSNPVGMTSAGEIQISPAVGQGSEKVRKVREGSG